MNVKIKKLHVLSAIIIIFTMLIVNFLTNDPFILLGSLVFILIVFGFTGNCNELKKGTFIFFPVLLLTLAINLFFLQQGNTVLFRIFGREITQEGVIYSVTMALKLFIIIFIFMCFQIIIDTDRAVSYFSSKLPKSTLVFLISLKLFPNLRIRLKNIKEVYTIRGVNFEGDKTKDKVKSYFPILSVLLENSLESAFDIGEASFVRGFLSVKRSVYDRQKFSNHDFIILTENAVLIMLYILNVFFNKSTINVSIIFVIVIEALSLILFSREKKYEIYRN